MTIRGVNVYDTWVLGAVRGTNNTAELVGVAEGLLWLRDHDGTHSNHSSSLRHETNFPDLESVRIES